MNNIKKIIEKKGMKLLAIAKILGISRTALWYKLTNKSEFTQSELKKLSDVLTCSISDLY